MAPCSWVVTKSYRSFFSVVWSLVVLFSFLFFALSSSFCGLTCRTRQHALSDDSTMRPLLPLPKKPHVILDASLDLICFGRLKETFGFLAYLVFFPFFFLLALLSSIKDKEQANRTHLHTLLWTPGFSFWCPLCHFCCCLVWFFFRTVCVIVRLPSPCVFLFCSSPP